MKESQFSKIRLTINFIKIYSYKRYAKNEQRKSTYRWWIFDIISG